MKTRRKKQKKKKKTRRRKQSPFLVAVIKTWWLTWFYSLLLLLSGDVQLNPGAKRNSSNAFAICQWNLNSISVHSYAKVYLLKAYIAIHKFYIICISEKYFDSSTPSDNSNLEISGYTIIIKLVNSHQLKFELFNNSMAIHTRSNNKSANAEVHSTNDEILIPVSTNIPIVLSPSSQAKTQTSLADMTYIQHTIDALKQEIEKNAAENNEFKNLITKSLIKESIHKRDAAEILYGKITILEKENQCLKN